MRSFQCISSNITSQKHFFALARRSAHGTALPTWLASTQKVILRRFVRTSKFDPVVDEVDLIDANPIYVHIRHNDSGESTMSLRDIASCPPFNNDDGENSIFQVSYSPNFQFLPFLFFCLHFLSRKLLFSGFLAFLPGSSRLLEFR